MCGSVEDVKRFISVMTGNNEICQSSYSKTDQNVRFTVFRQHYSHAVVSL